VIPRLLNKTATTLSTISLDPGTRLLRFAEFRTLRDSNFPWHTLNFIGPFWLDTKVSCGVYAVGIISPTGQVFDGRYSTAWEAYAVVVDI
jgi:hypothetical protein